MNKLYSIKLFEFIAIALILFALIILFHESSLDQILISPFYSTQIPHWPWRNHFITEQILHKGGVKLVALIVLAIIGLRFHPKVRANKAYQTFIYHTFLSALLSILLVAWLKKTTPILCPWSLSIYGGTREFISLTNIFNTTLKAGHCFPGGHSSGAYAWISIYFSYQLTTGRRNYKLLLPGILLGIIFGVTQQMRGAHFLSHDLATIFVCWITSGTLAILWKKTFNDKDSI